MVLLARLDRGLVSQRQDATEFGPSSRHVDDLMYPDRFSSGWV